MGCGSSKDTQTSSKAQPIQKDDHTEQTTVEGAAADYKISTKCEEHAASNLVNQPILEEPEVRESSQVHTADEEDELHQAVELDKTSLKNNLSDDASGKSPIETINGKNQAHNKDEMENESKSIEDNESRPVDSPPPSSDSPPPSSAVDLNLENTSEAAEEQQASGEAAPSSDEQKPADEQTPTEEQTPAEETKPAAADQTVPAEESTAEPAATEDPPAE